MHTVVEGGLQISQDDLDLFKKLKAQPKKITERSETIKDLKKGNKSAANWNTQPVDDSTQTSKWRGWNSKVQLNFGL